MSIIIYTGRDGVGKTSIACATSVQLAKEGLKTLVVSTDFSKIFSKTISSVPIEINENLWAVELNSHNQSWEIIHHWLRKNMKWDKLNGISTDEIPIIPGIKQLLNLLEVKKLHDEFDYDVIIIDFEIMSEILRLLSYPDLLEEWMKQLFKKDRVLYKMIRPLTKVVSVGFELPDDDVIDNGETLMKEVIGLQNIILNNSSFRLVLNPSVQDIEYGRKILTYYSMLGLHIDSVNINKILPDDAKNGYFSNWYHDQQAVIEEIKHSFNPLPIYKISFKKQEIEGLDLLNTFEEELPLSTNITKGPIQRLYKEKDSYILQIIVPQSDCDKIHFLKENDNLIIEMNGFKRIVFLPKILQKRVIKSHKHDGKYLSIEFNN